MLKIAVAQSEGVSEADVLQSLLAQCHAQLQGERPRVGILLASALLDYAPILQGLQEEWPGLPVIGTTTCGDMTTAGGFSLDSLSLLLIAGEDLQLSTCVLRQLGPDVRAPLREALQAAAPSDAQPPGLCLLFAESMTAHIEALSTQLQELLPPGCPIFGGLSAPPGFPAVQRNYQFWNLEVLGSAAVMLILHGEVVYDFSICNSWAPLGSRQVVTSATQNVVHRIGDRTALDFHSYYLGQNTRPASEFPLAVFDSDQEHFYMRVPQRVDVATGAVTFSGHIPEGATVQLTEALRPRMFEQLPISVAQAHAHIPTTQAKLVLAFSCATRRQILGTKVGEELRFLRDGLPGVPVFGFYCFGEFAPLIKGGPARLHSSTLVTVVLGCKEEPSPRAASAPAPPSFEQSLQQPALTEANFQLLQRKLARAEDYRAQMENTKDASSALLRTINAEVEAAHALIRQQNETLQRLYSQLEQEKQKSDQLLQNILPIDVAEELKRTGHVEPVYYPSATVLFTDFAGFTRIASRMSPSELIRELDFYFTAFDRIIEGLGLEKLKTIGDAYMAAGGIPHQLPEHALLTVHAAWQMRAFMNSVVAEKQQRGEPFWQIRIGINTGPLMAGVIGQKKFAYDIWGNTVNIASRMESTSEPGQINISQSTYELIKHAYRCSHRGKLYAKNAGEIDMYFVQGPDETAGEIEPS